MSEKPNLFTQLRRKWRNFKNAVIANASITAVQKYLQHWWNNRKKNSARRKIIRWSLFFIVVIAVFSYLTNPFVRFSIVLDPHNEVVLDDGQFQIDRNSDLILKTDPFFGSLAALKASWHIFSSKFVGGPKAPATTVDEIIAAIHDRRFDPDIPFIISGDHFSVLYPRSLGIFYHTALDPRTALDQEDWQNRQFVYLKTVAYALEVYDQTDRLSTTIVPVGPRSVVLVNIYAMPSDTLYSLLFGLERLLDTEYLEYTYPFETEAGQTYSLNTQTAGQKLLDQHRESLVGHYERFLRQTVDPATGLVKEDILLSGTKDMAKRQSAFYDNVMVWKTMQLAQKLGLVAENELALADLKQRIIDTFWLEEEGYFLEDLSSTSKENNYYSSDWLIAFQTGFLDPNNETDRQYLMRSAEYIQRNALDQPFGIQYSADYRPKQLYPLVRLSAPAYGSTAIWSNWGMEYTKMLIRLYQETGQRRYFEQAQDQVEAYTYNIKRYRGYPEVYDAQGDFFRQLFYKSIRQTGWVVTYEQARAMLESAE